MLNDLQRNIGADADLPVLAQLHLGAFGEAGYCEGFVAWRRNVSARFGLLMVVLTVGGLVGEGGCCVRGGEWQTYRSQILASARMWGYPLCRRCRIPRIAIQKLARGKSVNVLDRGALTWKAGNAF